MKRTIQVPSLKSAVKRIASLTVQELNTLSTRDLKKIVGLNPVLDAVCSTLTARHERMVDSANVG